MTESDSKMGIAIIGVAAKFPEAQNVDEFWDNLKSARDCISEIPRERWDHQPFFAADGRGAGKTNSKWGGFIDGAFDFDPLFFNISPKEAETMDPQSRQFIQCAYSAIEDSGYTRHALSDVGPVSVYVGASYHDYLQHSTNTRPIATPAGSIANIVSHFCDFKGPSMAVDTLCSSSLTALDLACRSILSGESPLAIAGAVNLIVHWNRYLLLSRNNMASKRGRCSSFSEQGDGYVPAEGVAALLLKPLHDAIRDNDNIYGVIRGTAVNHGGASIGQTVPKASEQARAIRAAMDVARVNSNEISYIEAHGPGTQLGDPIEIEGLNRAFALPPEAIATCAIGSVKSNIGHCESAAGIAGVIKVLLQFKHRLLVPSLHAAQLNSRIDFNHSPFRVQQVLEEWTAPPGAGDSFRRVAGVSSFGAVGTNAHVILEEYVGNPGNCAESAEPSPVAIVLSARTEVQLKQQIHNFYAAVGGLRDSDLIDVAYTLQVGREAMKARFACIASSVKQLSELLRRVIAQDDDTSFTFRGSKTSPKLIREIHGGDVSEDRIAQWLKEKDFNELLKLWVHGQEINWQLLYVQRQPRRVSLPTYPFAKEVHRVQLDQSDAPVEAESAAGVLHPLVQRNTSSLNGQRFSSVWTGDEFYLRDHVVKGRKVLPGVCYLEMARAAIEHSLGQEGRTRTSMSLRNVVWVRPLAVQNTQEVHIALSMQEGAEIGFEVYSAGTGIEDENIVLYAQGRAVLGDSVAGEADNRIDLSLLQSRCERSIAATQCYEVFSADGIEYGPAYQGLLGVQAGTNREGQRFALARISLPASVSETAEEYLLHPSIMDSALQSSIGLWLQNESAGNGKSSLPFALERLDIYRCSPATGYVYVREQAEHSGGSGRVRKLDILVCDEDGRVCACLQGYSTRATEKETNSEWGLLLLEPRWREEHPAKEAREDLSWNGQRWVLVDAIYQNYAARMRNAQHVRVDVWEGGNESGSDVTQYAVWVYERVREVMRSKPKQEVALQVVITAETAGSTLRGAVNGLLKSATLENPKLRCQVIEVAPSTTSESLGQILEMESMAFEDQAIRYGSAERCLSSYHELQDFGEAKPWKDGGVYLISGGAGGLGMIVAESIAREVRAARIVLIGRSVLSAGRQAKVDELRRSGARIEYECVNVTDASAVRGCVSRIVAQYGTLDGVVHGAGVIKDNFVINKSVAELREVLAPKVTGTIILDDATKDLPLGCFIVFGSASGVFGNVGQADYACANAFLDRYMEYRNELVKRGQRQGRSLSVDWPLWAQGGMRVSEVHLRHMHREGYAELSSEAGMAALYRAYASGVSQVVVLNGDVARIRRGLGVTVNQKNEPADTTGRIPEGQIDANELRAAIQAALIPEISALLKVREEEIDVDAQLSDFGFDSISLTELGNVLNQRYGLELAPTIFFEYPTVRSFVDYLGSEHAGQLASRLAVRSVSAAAAPKVLEVSEHFEAIPAAKMAGRRQSSQRPLATPAARQEKELVAIVGMSGCFPQAGTVEEFWENLKAGKDCITEIPRERWDWQALYGDPAREANKTNVKWGAFISGIEEFDPLFFGISPREAQLMDPNQRLLMTYAWSVLEDAGYSAQSVAGTKMGIFIATAPSGYKELATQAQVPIEGYSSTGSVGSMGPNRLSYFLDVHGPSEPIETACSSSLVAIHRGVRAIQSGDCDTALVGGIQTMVTPFGHISFSKAGMLSEDGRCKTFSAQANGYGRGEGVGMLMLKKLTAAERDNDHIYAVIKASAENHGGRANSLTAPNPKAQAQLLRTAYAEAAIDPRTIGYIEAHGTGTPLGDPVEINGLKMAFRDLYATSGDSEVKAAHCGLGSVKTNIGHLELSAGVAGVIKVLLQMKHRTLVKSLHCVDVNPYIQLQGSPFYLQQRTESWQAIEDDLGVELPRRAGVSSFGFGGVNAHVVLEEYRHPEDAQPGVIGGERPAMIVLSARNEERLRERARQLVEALGSGRFGRPGLADLAYTLQVGREAMTHRLALTATTLEQLQDKLRCFLDGEKSVEGMYRGDVNDSKEALEPFALDEDMQGVIGKWIERGKYGKLLDLWVKGLVFDWKLLYPESFRPRRVSLPTYPFARERYWIEPGEGAAWSGVAPQSQGEQAAVLHPLVQRNTSDLSGQRFSSRFVGSEFYLSGHVVSGSRVLPGVCYLEMARAAVEHSVGQELGEGRRVVLRGVAWLRPLVVEEARQVHIGLNEREDGEIEFEVYTTDGAVEGEEVVHAQGRAVVDSSLPQVDQIDLSALRAGCDRAIGSAQCYGAFSAMGIEYGAAHRGLQSVQVGTGNEGHRYVLAQVQLPACVRDTAEPYVLHPSVLDSALQASIGLVIDGLSAPSMNGAGPLRVPFALEQIQILGRSPQVAWVVVRSSAQRGASTADEALQKLDIDICDESGRVIVQLQGFTSRVLEGEVGQGRQASGAQIEQLAGAASAEDALTGPVLLAPSWEALVPPRSALWPPASSTVLLVGGTQAQQHTWQEHYAHARVLAMQGEPSVAAIAGSISALGPIDHVVWLAPAGGLGSVTDEALIQGQAAGVIGLYRLIKALLSLGYGAQPLGLSVVTCQTHPIRRGERIDATHGSVHGLVGSVAKEYGHWQVRLVDVPLESEGAPPQLRLEEVLRLPADPQGNAWAYRAGEWYRQQLILCELQQSLPSRYRQGGVYVVIGGAGGIGEVFSEYLIRTYQAQMIWIGRRPLDTAIQAKIDRLSSLGVAPTYLSADATDRDALEQAYQTIKARHGQINGLVHAAIALLDKSVAQMDEVRFKESLAAKVDVSVRMAQVFAPERLDCVLFFSSVQSFSKSAGQSNYAAGCTFMDAFAQQLAQVWLCPVKVMNWGYWGSVGIVASEAYRSRMAQLGIGSIEPAEGMAALEQLLSSPVSQVVLLKNTEPQVLSTLSAANERLMCVDEQLPSLIERLSPCSERVLALEPTQGAAVEDLQRLQGRLLFSQLQSLGLFIEARSSIATWRQQSELPALYGRWLDESVQILAGQGYLRVEGESCTVSDPRRLDTAALWAEWDAHKVAWLADPSLHAQVRVVEATLRALPQILTGKRLATEILFPNSSLALVAGVYKHNAVSDYFNAVLADAVVEFIAARCKEEPGARVRILEIGAGTGGTSEEVLARLKPYRAQMAQYCYTDLSKAFLLHAQEHYAVENPYLTTAIFDVERPLAAQSIPVGSYDLVIASNVLHATTHIRHTLRNAKAALKGNGLLLLNEISGHSVFAHLTFGLLEGWWLYDDAALRIPGTPALSPETWQRVLEEEGWRSIRFPARPAHGLGQQIIVAESDGMIRQPRAMARTPLERPSAAPARVRMSAAAGRDDVEHRSNLSGPLRERAIAALKKLVGQTVKIAVQQLDEYEPLETYGIDSLLVVSLSKELKEFFPDLSSTLFFEHRTIAALVEHFIHSSTAAVSRWVGLLQSGEGGQLSAVPARPMGHRGRRASLNASLHVGSEAATAAPRTLDVAIIGVSGRFPQAKDINEFWENLQAGKDCITEIPKTRWDHSQYFDPEKGKPGKSYSKWGGFIEGIDEFDPLFFRLSPLEAQRMDPQERLFLKGAYASIEDAGYTPASVCASKRVGVYVGVMNSTYARQANYWSIANRVSYLFDFQGPSMAVDTACSSSLTAIHLAVESIQSGACDAAIAGGVNLIIDPIQYMSLSAMTMLSSGNQCKSFGDQADGFVDGEGVGAIVLKPLHQATIDGDHIYGVIKGSMVNAGGKTHGYTVPNPVAQRELIQRALKKANIDPRTISYVEAHGTGTSLGDPIEIAGLTQAFSMQGADQQYCAIGSVKSNIGHLESAAGIAGLTKVLLQMRHRTLVPSLHSEVLNPHIDFARTPFKVQRCVEEWKRPIVEIDGESKEYPRIAGISSFGAGGANAHVIVEEYCEAEGVGSRRMVATRSSPALIVLSAKNEERLKEQASQLLGHIGTRFEGESELADMAYTLQVGREAMEHRLGLMVTSVDELREKLSAYVSGKTDIEDCYRGEVRRNKEALSLFTADEDLQRAIEAWVAKGKYAKVLELWAKGLPFDWSKLYEDGSAYGQGRPRRISLPTYPFAQERYWIEPSEGATSSGVAPQSQGEHAAVLHPLLQRNTSDLSGQRFSSRFAGSEFYLSDHVVSGSRVLPGVCYLEMARAAVEHSVGQELGEGRRVVLRGVVWLRPLVVEGAREVHIGLNEREDGEIEFEVYTTDGAVEGEEVVHAQGRAVLTEGGSESAAADRRVDLSVLRAGSDRLVDGVACYTAFAAMGLEYGASHRGLVGLRTGQDAKGGSYVLAQVKLPANVSATQDQYYLHPSVLDSALQASVGLSLEATDGADMAMRPALPFALERLEILGRSPVDAWVYVRPSAGEATGNGSIRKLDVDICDETGLTCVRLRGFTARVLEGAVGQSMSAADGREAATEEGLLLLSPVWRQKELPADAVAATDGERWVLVDCAYQEHVAGLEASHPSVKWEVLPDCGGGAVGERFVAASEAVFARVQSILGSKPKQSVFLQVLADAEPAEIPLALSGLLKSAGRENPRFQGQVIAINNGGLDAAAFEQMVQENASAAARGAADVRYVGGLREVRGFEELSHPTSAVRAVPWKDGGVYLITGGAGGLGLIIAEEIARHATDAKVILTGRGSLSEAKRVQIEALQGHGSHVQYRGLDVTDEAAVQGCVSAIVAEHGCLSGIVHSAGVIHDNFIIKKSHEEFRSVLSPKVSGVVNLDRATQALDLDFLILFSSLAGVSGNVGQSDYALANAFMDQYASYRNGLLSLGERRGRTLSVNWPLWQDGGMSVDEATREQMRRQGLDALNTQDGLDALYAAWQSGESQVAVVVGDRVRIREWMANRIASAASAGADTDTTDLLTTVEQAVIHEIARQLMVKVEDIDAGAEFSEFGFDSISLTTFGNTLSKTYGVEMTPAVFFEYPTVHSFATYLLNEHAQRMRETIAVPAMSALKTAPLASEWPDRIQSTPKRQRSRVNQDRSAAKSGEPEPIAIIGMDGSFPQASSIEEFWENLKAGKDCITEIPQERWSLQDFYEPDPKVAAQASKSYGKWGGFMGGRSTADSSLAREAAQELGVNPEAEAFFTVIENLLQNAALTKSDLKARYQGSVGIYVGAMADAVSGASGVSPAVLANAVSRFYNIHGPSVAIDTWCSSSLTALHFACEGMARGDCKIAVAAGFHFLKPNDYVVMSNHKMLGSHIGSRSFTSGDGMIPGEGVGAVLLKPLSRALADEDVVLAVIRSTSIAHCGTNASQEAQTRMFLDNLAKSGVDSQTISYVEAGAVGSLLGDALEVFALTRAFEKSVPPGWSCPIGSVKPGIGHAMGVSGLFQLVKVVLQIQHRQLVPTIGDSREGHFANKPFHLQRELVEWPTPRRAIINSFGGGGSYVNVILEDPPEQLVLPALYEGGS